MSRDRPLQVQPTRHQVHDGEDADIVQQGREDRGNDDRGVGHLEELGHDEGRRAHDRRSDLPAGAGRGLDPTREMAGIAQPLHVGNGQRPGRHGIGHGRARDRAEEGRGHYRDLGRSAGILPGEDRRVVNK